MTPHTADPNPVFFCCTLAAMISREPRASRYGSSTQTSWAQAPPNARIKGCLETRRGRPLAAEQLWFMPFPQLSSQPRLNIAFGGLRPEALWDPGCPRALPLPFLLPQPLPPAFLQEDVANQNAGPPENF